MACSNQKDDPLSNIVFISIPETLRRTIGDFEIDPSILLPVEIPSGKEKFRLEDLSWEMIIAAMLKILAYNPQHKDASYYRSFILTVKPEIVEELNYTAIFKAQNRDFNIAEEIFLSLVNLNTKDVNPLLNLALLYEQRAEEFEKRGSHEMKENYMEKAFITYKKAISQFPDSPETNFYAGHFFIKIHNYEKAESHFLKYLENPTDERKREKAEKIVMQIDSYKRRDSLFKEAYDYIRMGKEEKGIEKIKLFLKSNPNIPNGWFLLGWGYRRLKSFEKAKEAFLKVIELGQKDVDTLNELAICYMESEDYKNSKSCLKEALKKEPENVKIISNLGILSLKEKNIEEAKGYFRTVLEIDPEDSIAKQYLSYLEKK